MTFVFREYAGTYNYSYFVTDDCRRNISPLSSSVDEEPEPNWSWTLHLQNSNQAGTFLKVLRTSTEPNEPLSSKYPNQTRNQYIGFFPIANTAYTCLCYWVLKVHRVCLD